MKKLLLSLAAVVLGFTAATAQTTINMSDIATSVDGKSADYTISGSGFTFNIKKNKGATNPTYNTTGKDLRTYAKATIEVVSTTEMTDIVFNISTQGKKRLAPITASVGTIAAQAEGAETVTWSGSAKSVTFTVGDNATYGTDGATKAGQLDFYSVVIATAGGSVIVKDNAEMSFPEATYTVKFGDAFNAPKVNKATDAVPVYSSDKEAVATVDPATGDVTIVGVGTAIITATCAETADFYAGTAKYTLVVEDPNTFWAPNCKDKTNPEFTFVAVNGDFQPWSVDDRYGLKASAFKSSAANASDAVAASPVLDFTEYKAPMTLDYRQVLNQFKVNNVLIDCTDEAVAPYVSVVAKEEGAAEWTKIGDVNAPVKFGWDFYDGTTVDLSAFAGKKVQIGFRYVSTTECAGTWEIDNVVVKATKNSDAVESIVAEDTNAPVEYYNLQGVRVANPAAGNLYIVRQGNKVSKQIIK
ncbi:MAG: choice-of-anchor J domain-containing protein [Muribaculaceae bacterium]